MTSQALEVPLEQFPSLTWDEVAPRASIEIRGALERVLERQDGACLTDDERYHLAHCNEADLLAVLVAANDLRRELVGNIVSYVVIATLISPIFVSLDASSAPSAAGLGKRTHTFIPSKTWDGRRKKPGMLEQPKSASRAVCHMVCRRFTIATSCAR